MQGVRPSSQNVRMYPRPITGGFLKIKSYAKLNLFLDVVSKRADGYHNIVSVMQSVDLCDEIEFYKTRGTGFTFITDGEEIPKGESNLVCRAARAMIVGCGIKESFEIRLIKRIPVGAGLGGGSGNCAATLHGINSLFDLNISGDELLQIGMKLGADVPFCLTGGTCLAEGIGEKLTPLERHPDCHIVIAHPNVHVSTKEMFLGLKDSVFCGGKKKLASLLSGLSNNDLTKVALSFYNVFADLTIEKVPEVGLMLTLLESGGALGSSMTGTGSAVFGYFVDRQAALCAAEKLKKIGRVFLARPIS